MIYDKLSDCWETPEWLFNELDQEFNFDIDLCANESNRKCEYWCKDYLTTDLSPFLQVSSAFMNPPYSKPKPFIEKAWEDSKHRKIVCLVKCDPSTEWWATFWDHKEVVRCGSNNRPVYYHGPKPGCQVRFFPKRIKFDPPKGWEGKAGSPAFPSALIIMDRRSV